LLPLGFTADLAALDFAGFDFAAFGFTAVGFTALALPWVDLLAWVLAMLARVPLGFTALDLMALGLVAATADILGVLGLREYPLLC